MTSQHRLARLRALLEQLERLPASEERDRMLREVRDRIVDVDTGVTPRAMLPVDSDSMLAPGRAQPAIRARKTHVRAPAESGRRADPGPIPLGPIPLIGDDGLPRLGAGEPLSLDDVTPLPPARGPDAARPWTRGLRG